MPKRGKSPRDAPGEVDKTNSKDAPPKNESTGSLKRKKKKEKGPIVAPVVIPDVSETSDEEEEEMEEEDEDVEIDETPAAPFGDELPPDEDDLTPPERFGLPEWNVPCSYFFQQQGAMDYESYLRLKAEERQAGFQYAAARSIQAAWRGFITRYKLKILTLAAIKIQSWIRGFLARRRVGKILEEKAEELRQQDLDEAATKIQAAWRGHNSRKTKLNSKDYKKIQEKNDALKKSIESINKLEMALTKDDGTAKDMNDLLRHSIPDLANLSASRVAELHAYASDGDLDGRPSFDMPEPITPSGWDGKFTSTSKKPKFLKRFSSGSRPACKDSVDDLFPEFPNKEGLIRPDPTKVEALKQAIRLLKKRIGTKEERELKKVHHLLRTNRPGVYSDIYCNELTEFEKQIKSVKYWTAPPDPRIKKKPFQGSTSEQEDLKEEDEEIASSDNHVDETAEEEQEERELETFEADEVNTSNFDVIEDFEIQSNEIHA